MTNPFCIRSKLLDNNNFVLLAEVAGAGAETPIEVGSISPTAAPTLGQQWFGKRDPSGNFFITSAQNESLVMNIKGASEATPQPSGNAALLDINTPESGWHQKQLWTFSLQTPGSPYMFIQSALTAANGKPYVLNISGSWSESKRPPKGTRLDVTPQSGADNELWTVVVPAGGSGVVPGDNYNSEVSLSAFPAANANFVQIKGTGFAPGWLSVPMVSVSAPEGTGLGTFGPQTDADTVVNFDGTFQTAVNIGPFIESPIVYLYVEVVDSFGIPYQINATVNDNLQVEITSQARNAVIS